MADRAKGDLFIQTLNFVRGKWGLNGLEKAKAKPSDYLPEKWYDFDDYCALLERIHENVADSNPDALFRMGQKMIKSDPRWCNLFKDENPKNIFISTRRQSGQYECGEFLNEIISDKHLEIKNSEWETDHRYMDMWSEFYRGRMQGVLDLTGRKGAVKKELRENEVVYTITWK